MKCVLVLMISCAAFSSTETAFGQMPVLWKNELLIRSFTGSGGTPSPSGFSNNFDLDRSPPTFDIDGTAMIVGTANGAGGSPLNYSVAVVPPGGTASIVYTVAISSGTVSGPIDARDGLLALAGQFAPIGGGTLRSAIRIITQAGSVVGDIDAGGPLGATAGFSRPRLGPGNVDIGYRTFAAGGLSFIVETIGASPRAQVLVAEPSGQFASLTSPAISRNLDFAALTTEVATPPPNIAVLNAWSSSGANTQLYAATLPGEQLNEVSEFDGTALLHVYRASSTSPRELRLTTGGLAGTVLASNAAGSGRNGFENAATLNVPGAARLFDDQGVAFIGRRSGLDAIYITTTSIAPVRIIGDGDAIVTADGTKTFGFTGSGGRESIHNVAVLGDLEVPCEARILFNARLDDASGVLVLLTPCIADYSRDGTVDPDDLSDYIAGYFADPPDARADVNCDGIVDPDDLADFIARYFAGC